VGVPRHDARETTHHGKKTLADAVVVFQNPPSSSTLAVVLVVFVLVKLVDTVNVAVLRLLLLPSLLCSLVSPPGPLSNTRSAADDDPNDDELAALLKARRWAIFLWVQSSSFVKRQSLSSLVKSE
jgi:hypothetical protein